MSRLAVITIAHGRHEHLLRQFEGLAAGTVTPDDHIVVAMDDPELTALAATRAHVVGIDREALGLPLAAARNVGADAAISRGAEVLVFLDVDCIPAPTLIEAYRDAAADATTERTILCGPVAYLPPAPAGGYDLATLADLAPPHPARPAPPPGTIEIGGDHKLFWSLSFALSRETWRELGGFHEGYVGYGGEDTDFARVAQRRGIQLAWVGSALAHHQHHAVESPPVRHLDDILRNGAIFEERWGEWPMAGWLEGFERMGLVRRDAKGWSRADGAGTEAERGGDDGNRTRVISLED